MYSNLKSDEKRRQEVISCLYWSLMQNWNIPQSMQDYFGLTEDYRLYHQLEDMDPAIYRQKRATGEIPDVLEVDARLTRAVEKIFESICERPPVPYLNKLNDELEKLGQIAHFPDNVHDTIISVPISLPSTVLTGRLLRKSVLPRLKRHIVNSMPALSG